MANELPTDFEDDVLDQAESSAAAEATPVVDTDQPNADNGKDQDGVPYCVRHHCRMKHASSGRKGSKVAYYKCPVKGCDETAKRIKTGREQSIPTEPRCCGRCVDGKGDPVVMERDDRLSKPFYSILRCPACQAKTEPLPRPEFVASHGVARRRQHVPDVGDR